MLDETRPKRRERWAPSDHAIKGVLIGCVSLPILAAAALGVYARYYARALETVRTRSDTARPVPWPLGGGSGIGGRLKRVVSGDTFILTDRDPEPTVRMVGIACPGRGEPGFEEAVRFTEGALGGKLVVVMYPDGDRERRDREGRLVAYAGTVETPDVGLELLRKGLARIDPGGRHPMEEEYAEAAAAAAGEDGE